MPKIIENPRTRLLEETKKQMLQDGYGALNIRELARVCGISVGTVYNYFPSKEALVASYLLEDWNQRMEAIRRVCLCADAPQPVCRCIYDHLTDFAGYHLTIFRDQAAAAAIAGGFSRYHALLREQLAVPLVRFAGSEFAALFIAESLLTWTMAGKTFDEIYGILEKLF